MGKTIDLESFISVDINAKVDGNGILDLFDDEELIEELEARGIYYESDPEIEANNVYEEQVLAELLILWKRGKITLETIKLIENGTE